MSSLEIGGEGEVVEGDAFGIRQFGSFGGKEEGVVGLVRVQNLTSDGSPPSRGYFRCDK